MLSWIDTFLSSAYFYAYSPLPYYPLHHMNLMCFHVIYISRVLMFSFGALSLYSLTATQYVGNTHVIYTLADE